MSTPKYQFCQEVLKFLRSEYQDSYAFEIEYYQNPEIEEIELLIKTSGLTQKISGSYMNHFYLLFCEGKFLEDRGQYLWQKELVDLIEGN